MAIITDVATPADLSRIARVAVNKQEADTTSLVQFLPNTMIAGTVARTYGFAAVRGEIAQVRAFDAEAPKTNLPAQSRITFDLPSVAQEIPITEAMQLQSQTLPDTARRQGIVDATALLGRNIVDAVESMRGQLLVDAHLKFEGDNQVYIDQDFGRDASMAPTASVEWSDPKAPILSNLMDWVEAYSDLNGYTPSTVVLGSKTLLAMTKNKEFVSTATDKAAAARITPDAVRDVLASFGITTVITNDRKVRDLRGTRRIVPVNRVLLLPSPSEITPGVTVYGTTAEAADPAYGYSIGAAEAPGIAVAAHRRTNPAQISVHGTAIVSPVLVNPNLAMAAHVSEV